MVRRWFVDETAKADENEDENEKEGRRPQAGAREAQAEQNRGAAIAASTSPKGENELRIITT